MASAHGQKGYPLPVEEQTALDAPIKVKWNQSQATHARMVHSLTACKEDANEDEPLIGAGLRAMCRQKTQVVVKTVEEAEDLLYELDQYSHPYGINAPGGRTDVYERVRGELVNELERRGWFIDIHDIGRPDIKAQ